MKVNWWALALLGIMALGVVACDGGETPEPDDNGLTYAERLKRDVDSLKVYLDDHLDSIRTVHNNPDLDYQEDSTGLMWIVYEEGAGPFAQDGDIAYTYYRGSLMNGAVFDQNLDGLPFQFTVASSGVIQGWNIGIKKFQAGTRGYLFLPSPLAYGTQSQGTIPANSILIFNMEVVELR